MQSTLKLSHAQRLGRAGGNTRLLLSPTAQITFYSDVLLLQFADRIEWTGLDAFPASRAFVSVTYDTTVLQLRYRIKLACLYTFRLFAVNAHLRVGLALLTCD